MAEAAAIAAGLFTSPLNTLQLWEDTKASPDDYRSVASTKKGSGPKVQTKFQADPSGKFTQDGVKTPSVPGDGVTYATPISMGVSINETWSYQIYNYSGIGYYPATAPMPWPPPPPKTQSQPVGTAGLNALTMSGTPLPAEPPDRTAIPSATAKWSPVPQWVIYPVAKIVNKSYVLQQSTEVYAQKTVSVTAGVRPGTDLPPGAPPIDPTNPYRTYPSDVKKWVNVAGVKSNTYQDTAGNMITLPATTTYDRNLLHDPDMQFPDPVTLSGWILNAGTNLPIRDYSKVEQVWTETHVGNQATIVRANNTISDTVVGTQNTKVAATTSVTNTAVSGLQHTILHTGMTTTETTVDGTQSTTVHAHEITTNTTAAVTSAVSITTGLAFSASYASMVLALKATVIDIQLAIAIHMGVNVGAAFDLVVGPHLQLKLLDMVVAANNLRLTGEKTSIDGAVVKSDSPAGSVKLAPVVAQ